MTSSYPAPPIKPVYQHCPACNDHATTLQTTITLPDGVNGPAIPKLYCPNCGWYEVTICSLCQDCGRKCTPEDSTILHRGYVCNTCQSYPPQKVEPMFQPTGNAQMKVVGDNFVGSSFEMHSTGAMRSTDADSVRFDLIPQRMLERVAKVMATGAIKYGEYNWQKGFKWSSCFNHLARHSYLYLIGDKTEDHLAHMVCNLGFLIEFETSHPELNDIPSRQEKA